MTATARKPGDLIARLRRMGDRDTRHDYEIGDYWNVVDEAADELATERANAEALAIERGALETTIANLSNLHDKQIEQLADELVKVRGERDHANRQRWMHDESLASDLRAAQAAAKEARREALEEAAGTLNTTISVLENALRDPDLSEDHRSRLQLELHGWQQRAARIAALGDKSGG